MAAARPNVPLTVEALKHDEAKRKNIPTAEYESVMARDQQKLVRVEYQRAVAGNGDERAQRNRDLDPQLVWRGKDQQDWSNLVVQAAPLNIQEEAHPKVLVDELRRESERRREATAPDHDDSEFAFHPSPGNLVLAEWKRKNIENYLLVPDAWKRVALRQLRLRDDDLFAEATLKLIDGFFIDQNLTLPPGRTGEVLPRMFSACWRARRSCSKTPMACFTRCAGQVQVAGYGDRACVRVSG